MKAEYDFSDAKQGAIVKNTKKAISIRLDSEVIDFFKDQVHKSGGGSYQALINQALRDHIDGKVMSIILRDAVHDAVVEELKAA